MCSGDVLQYSVCSGDVLQVMSVCVVVMSSRSCHMSVCVLSVSKAARLHDCFYKLNYMKFELMLMDYNY